MLLLHFKKYSSFSMMMSLIASGSFDRAFLVKTHVNMVLQAFPAVALSLYI